ncbi:MAG: YdcF family protein [Candidatus Omnitrophica bacterium]|nr:YdcF family protein [Candidatus Omnitrophota bacterium]
MRLLKLCEKFVAGSVAVCFFASLLIPSPVVLAQPEGLPMVSSFVPLGIPSELAKIEEAFIPDHQKGSAPPLIHIQSVHSHPETQKKIYALLKFLDEKYGIDSMFIEGAGEKLNPDYFRFFEDNRLNVRVAEKLVEKGELTGAELFLVESTRDIPAYGIEDPALYQRNLTSFQYVMRQRPATAQFTKGLRGSLDRLETLLLEKEARKLLRSREAFDSGQMELLSYALELERAARSILGIDIRYFESQLDWPQMIRLLRLQEIEAKLNPEKVQADRQNLVGSLKSFGLDRDLVEGFENLSFSPYQSGMVYDPGFRRNDLPRYLAERLVGATLEKGFAFEQYPDFTRYLEAAILQSELEAGRLFEEIERLFDKIMSAVSGEAEDKKFVGLVHKERLYERLFDLELTPKDYAKVQTENPDERPLIRFLVELEALHERTPLGKRKLVPSNSDTLESIFGEALRFYELAKQREETMVEKILTSPSPLPSPPKGERARMRGITILITGGFHTAGLSHTFREKQIPYTILTPHITEKVNSEDYVSALLGEKKTAFDTANLDDAAHFQPAEVRFGRMWTPSTRQAKQRSELRVVLEGLATVAHEKKISAGKFASNFSQSLYGTDRRAELRLNPEGDRLIPILDGKPLGFAIGTSRLVQESFVPAPVALPLSRSELRHFTQTGPATEQREALDENAQVLFDFLAAREVYDVKTDKWKPLEGESWIQEGPFDLVIVFGSSYREAAEGAAKIAKKAQDKNPDVIIVPSGRGPVKRPEWYRPFTLLKQGVETEVPEAEFFADQMLKAGVGAENIIPELKATNTGENTRYVREIVDELRKEGRLRDDATILLLQNGRAQKRGGRSLVKQFNEGRSLSKIGIRKVVSLSPFRLTASSLNQATAILEIQKGIDEIRRFPGYAEQGFMDPIQVPEEVSSAIASLQTDFPQLFPDRSEARATESEEALTALKEEVLPKIDQAIALAPRESLELSQKLAELKERSEEAARLLESGDATRALVVLEELLDSIFLTKPLVSSQRSPDELLDEIGQIESSATEARNQTDEALRSEARATAIVPVDFIEQQAWRTFMDKMSELGFPINKLLSDAEAQNGASGVNWENLPNTLREIRKKHGNFPEFGKELGRSVPDAESPSIKKAILSAAKAYFRKANALVQMAREVPTNQRIEEVAKYWLREGMLEEETDGLLASQFPEATKEIRKHAIGLGKLAVEWEGYIRNAIDDAKQSEGPFPGITTFRDRIFTAMKGSGDENRLIVITGQAILEMIADNAKKEFTQEGADAASLALAEVNQKIAKLGISTSLDTLTGDLGEGPVLRSEARSQDLTSQLEKHANALSVLLDETLLTFEAKEVFSAILNPGGFQLEKTIRNPETGEYQTKTSVLKGKDGLTLWSVLTALVITRNTRAAEPGLTDDQIESRRNELELELRSGLRENALPLIEQLNKFHSEKPRQSADESVLESIKEGDLLFGKDRSFGGDYYLHVYLGKINNKTHLFLRYSGSAMLTFETLSNIDFDPREKDMQLYGPFPGEISQWPTDLRRSEARNLEDDTLTTQKGDSQRVPFARRFFDAMPRLKPELKRNWIVFFIPLFLLLTSTPFLPYRGGYRTPPVRIAEEQAASQFKFLAKRNPAEWDDRQGVLFDVEDVNDLGSFGKFQEPSFYFELLRLAAVRSKLRLEAQLQRVGPDPLFEGLNDSGELLELLSRPDQIIEERVRGVRHDTYRLVLLHNLELIEALVRAGSNKLKTTQQWKWLLEMLKDGHLLFDTDTDEFYSLRQVSLGQDQKPAKTVEALLKAVNTGVIDPSTPGGQKKITDQIRHNLESHGIFRVVKGAKPAWTPTLASRSEARAGVRVFRIDSSIELTEPEAKRKQPEIDGWLHQYAKLGGNQKFDKLASFLREVHSKEQVNKSFLASRVRPVLGYDEPRLNSIVLGLVQDIWLTGTGVERPKKARDQLVDYIAHATRVLLTRDFVVHLVEEALDGNTGAKEELVGWSFLISAGFIDTELVDKILERVTPDNSIEVRNRASEVMEQFIHASVSSTLRPDVLLDYLTRLKDLEGPFWRFEHPISVLEVAITRNPDLSTDARITKFVRELRNQEGATRFETQLNNLLEKLKSRSEARMSTIQKVLLTATAAVLCGAGCIASKRTSETLQQILNKPSPQSTVVATEQKAGPRHEPIPPDDAVKRDLMNRLFDLYDRIQRQKQRLRNSSPALEGEEFLLDGPITLIFEVVRLVPNLDGRDAEALKKELEKMEKALGELENDVDKIVSEENKKKARRKLDRLKKKMEGLSDDLDLDVEIIDEGRRISVSVPKGISEVEQEMERLRRQLFGEIPEAEEEVEGGELVVMPELEKEKLTPRPIEAPRPEEEPLPEDLKKEFKALELVAEEGKRVVEKKQASGKTTEKGLKPQEPVELLEPPLGEEQVVREKPEPTEKAVPSQEKPQEITVESRQPPDNKKEELLRRARDLKQRLVHLSEKEKREPAPPELAPEEETPAVSPATIPTEVTVTLTRVIEEIIEKEVDLPGIEKDMEELEKAIEELESRYRKLPQPEREKLIRWVLDRLERDGKGPGVRIVNEEEVVREVSIKDIVDEIRRILQEEKPKPGPLRLTPLPKTPPEKSAPKEAQPLDKQDLMERALRLSDRIQSNRDKLRKQLSPLEDQEQLREEEAQDLPLILELLKLVPELGGGDAEKLAAELNQLDTELAEIARAIDEFLAEEDPFEAERKLDRLQKKTDEVRLRITRLVVNLGGEVPFVLPEEIAKIKDELERLRQELEARKRGEEVPWEKSTRPSGQTPATPFFEIPSFVFNGIGYFFIFAVALVAAILIVTSQRVWDFLYWDVYGRIKDAFVRTVFWVKEQFEGFLYWISKSYRPRVIGEIVTFYSPDAPGIPYSSSETADYLSLQDGRIRSIYGGLSFLEKMTNSLTQQGLGLSFFDEMRREASAIKSAYESVFYQIDALLEENGLLLTESAFRRLVNSNDDRSDELRRLFGLQKSEAYSLLGSPVPAFLKALTNRLEELNRLTDEFERKFEAALPSFRDAEIRRAKSNSLWQLSLAEIAKSDSWDTKYERLLIEAELNLGAFASGLNEAQAKISPVRENMGEWRALQWGALSRLALLQRRLRGTHPELSDQLKPIIDHLSSPRSEARAAESKTSRVRFEKRADGSRVVTLKDVTLTAPASPSTNLSWKLRALRFPVTGSTDSDSLTLFSSLGDFANQDRIGAALPVDIIHLKDLSVGLPQDKKTFTGVLQASLEKQGRPVPAIQASRTGSDVKIHFDSIQIPVPPDKPEALTRALRAFGVPEETLNKVRAQFKEVETLATVIANALPRSEARQQKPGKEVQPLTRFYAQSLLLIDWVRRIVQAMQESRKKGGILPSEPLIPMDLFDPVEREAALLAAQGIGQRELMDQLLHPKPDTKSFRLIQKALKALGIKLGAEFDLQRDLPQKSEALKTVRKLSESLSKKDLPESRSELRDEGPLAVESAGLLTSPEQLEKMIGQSAGVVRLESPAGKIFVGKTRPFVKPRGAALILPGLNQLALQIPAGFFPEGWSASNALSLVINIANVTEGIEIFDPRINDELPELAHAMILALRENEARNLGIQEQIDEVRPSPKTPFGAQLVKGENRPARSAVFLEGVPTVEETVARLSPALLLGGNVHVTLVIPYGVPADPVRLESLRQEIGKILGSLGGSKKVEILQPIQPGPDGVAQLISEMSDQYEKWAAAQPGAYIEPEFAINVPGALRSELGIDEALQKIRGKKPIVFIERFSGLLEKSRAALLAAKHSQDALPANLLRGFRQEGRFVIVEKENLDQFVPADQYERAFKALLQIWRSA